MKPSCSFSLGVLCIGVFSSHTLADWRAEADARIDANRKAEFSLSVTDAAEQPVPGAVVEMEMQRHAFNFGTAVRGARILAETEDAAIYRDTILDHFNTIVFGNGHKWRFWERDGRYDLEIYGEDTGSADAFSATAGDITQRSRTDAVVAWSGVHIHNVGTPIQTPDIKPLMDEILSRQDWQSGNDMAFLFPAGQGDWSFYSQEGRRANAAQLVVHLTDGTVERWAVWIRADDAEEDPDSMEMNLESNDLDIGGDSAGVRFQGITLEDPDDIASAYIQFIADSDSLNGDVTRAATDWAFDHDLEIRLHALMWARSDATFLPNDIRDAINEGSASNEVYIRERITDHFEDIGQYHNEIVRWWDVLNEHPHEHLVTDFLNPDDPTLQAAEIPLWFEKARNLAGGEAVRVLNDFDLITSADGSATNRGRNLAIVDHVRDNGGTVDGIGMQGHFYNTSRRSTPETMYNVFEQFAAENFRIEITEYDYWGNFSASEAAEMTEELYRVAFSHPNVDSIMQWGFWDGQHWQNSGVMFDRNWNLKEAGAVYQNLVTDDWWTNTTELPEDQRMTDLNGAYSHRVFKGEYWIRVRAGDREVAMLTSSDTDRTFDLQLPESGQRVLVQALRRFDDAVFADGTVSLLDATLTLDGDNTIGLRFRDIPVPAGARLAGAYLHLYPDAASAESVELEISVESSLEAAPFNNKPEAFSSRVIEDANITWSLSDRDASGWVISPDLTSSLPDPGNRSKIDMGFQIKAVSGLLEVHSLDQDSATAPILELVYEPWTLADFLPASNRPEGSWEEGHFMGRWYIRESAFPFAYHESLGWLAIYPIGPDSAWFYELETGEWWYTSEKVFPWRYLYDSTGGSSFWDLL